MVVHVHLVFAMLYQDNDGPSHLFCARTCQQALKTGFAQVDAELRVGFVGFLEEVVNSMLVVRREAGDQRALLQTVLPLQVRPSQMGGLVVVTSQAVKLASMLIPARWALTLEIKESGEGSKYEAKHVHVQ